MLINAIPSMVLTYIPFRRKVKVRPLWGYTFNIAIFVGYIVTYYLLAPSYFSYSFLQAYKLTLIIPGIFIAFAIIDESNYKIFYFNLMMITYIVIAAKVANYITFNLFDTPSHFILAMANLGVFSVSLPFMLLYHNWMFRLTAEAVESSETDIWRIIWIVPLLFTGICLSSNLKFEIDIIRKPQFIILILMTAAGMFISTSVLLRTLRQANLTARSREYAKVAEQQLVMQGEQYKMIAENIERTKVAKHDLRHHLSVLAHYAEKEDIQALQKYLWNYIGNLNEEADEHFCDNSAVNAILRYYGAMAREAGITLDIDIKVPREININNLDLSVIFGNCMENAIEACLHMSKEVSQYIKLKTRLEGQTFAIIIVNSFDGEIRKEKEQYLSRKRTGTGIGLSSVTLAAKKYGGSATFEVKDNEFWVSVIMFLPCVEE